MDNCTQFFERFISTLLKAVKVSCINTSSVTTIRDLNDDCLIHIFCMLPIIDQIKIKRVCKRWRFLSRKALNELQRFEVYNKKFWGITEESKIRINSYIFKNILKLYGRKITHIDLTYENGAFETTYRPYDQYINVIPDKYVFESILDWCPSITSLNVGQGCWRGSLQFIAENFRNLIYLKLMIKKLRDYGDDDLSRLCSNNKHLKSLTLHYETFPFSCFSNLNSESIEEIHLISRQSCFMDLVFQNFEKIHTVTVEHPFDSYIQIVKTLKRMSLHLQNLRKLKLNFYLVNSTDNNDSRTDNMDRNVLFEGYNFMITLTKLEELHIVNKYLVNNDFMEIVCNNCKKLKTLKIEDSDEITDEGMSKIELLPNLQNLYIKGTEVTGSFLMSEVPKLKKLVFDDCGSLRNEGIINLLLNSQCISNLEITFCPCINVINGTNIIDEVVKNIESCRFKYVKININAAANSYFSTDIETLEISGKYYTRINKKFCMECNIRKQNDWKPENDQPCGNCLNTTFVHKISKK